MTHCHHTPLLGTEAAELSSLGVSQFAFVETALLAYKFKLLRNFRESEPSKQLSRRSHLQLKKLWIVGVIRINQMIMIPVYDGYIHFRISTPIRIMAT